MAIAFVQKAGAASSASTLSSLVVPVSSATTLGNTLFLGVRSAASIHISSVTDTQGNTWTVDAYSGAANNAGNLVRCSNAKALSTSDSVTINFSGASSVPCATLVEFSGLGASPPDQTATANGSGSTTLAVGPTGTTTQANELALTVIAGGNATYTPPTGWTAVPSGQSTNTQDLAYLILSSTQTVSGTWTCNISPSMGAVIATYETPAPAPPAAGFMAAW